LDNFIDYSDFEKVIMVAGTILTCCENTKARKPSYILEIDFGLEWGIKKSSAQITDLYDSETLIGKQVTAVINFPPMRIAGVKSEVLVLGVPGEDGSVVLLHPERSVENGKRIF
jgi:tRNA-binding protein